MVQASASAEWHTNVDGPGIRLTNLDVASGSPAHIAWPYPDPSQFGLYSATDPLTRSPHITVLFTCRMANWTARAAGQILVVLVGPLGLTYRLQFQESTQTFTANHFGGTSESWTISAAEAEAFQTRLIPIVVSWVDGVGVNAWFDGHLKRFADNPKANGNVTEIRLGPVGGKQQVGPFAEFGQLLIYNEAITDAGAKAWSADPYGWTRPPRLFRQAPPSYVLARSELAPRVLGESEVLPGVVGRSSSGGRAE